MFQAGINWAGINRIEEPLERFGVRQRSDVPAPAVVRAGAELLSDEALMARVGAGDRQAYGVLVDRHFARSCGLAARVIGAISTDAEDVVQEAFLRLWKHAPNWRPKGAKFTTWFYRVVMNLCIDAQRKARKKTLPLEAAGEPADDAPSSETILHRNQIAARIGLALGDIPERQRAAISLCYFDGLSNREAAGVLDVNIKGLESLLSRGRKGLRERLGDLADEIERD